MIYFIIAFEVYFGNGFSPWYMVVKDNRVVKDDQQGLEQPMTQRRNKFL
jgi:hypothetical protein